MALFCTCFESKSTRSDDENSNQKIREYLLERDLSAFEATLNKMGTNIPEYVGDWPILHAAVLMGTFSGSKAEAFAVGAVNALLLKGIRINSRDFQGCTVLHIAAKLGMTAVVSTLLDWPACLVGATNQNGKSPLHLATENGHVEAARLLVEKGKADVNALDLWQQSPLHLAYERQNTALVSMLMGAGANVQCKNRMGKIPVHLQTSMAPLLAFCALVTAKEFNTTLSCLIHPEKGIFSTKEFQDLLKVNGPEFSEDFYFDIFKIHDYEYIKKMEVLCGSLDNPQGKLCCHSYASSFIAVGSVCQAVDMVLEGTAHNAFCVISPPGSAASCCSSNPTKGSVFNSVAVGASYAMYTYRTTIKRLALIDFGGDSAFEEIICNLKPPKADAAFPKEGHNSSSYRYKPWLKEDDSPNVIFLSLKDSVKVTHPTSCTSVVAGSSLEVNWGCDSLFDEAVSIFLYSGEKCLELLQSDVDVSVKSASVTISKSMVSNNNYSLRFGNLKNTLIFGCSAQFFIQGSPSPLQSANLYAKINDESRLKFRQTCRSILIPTLAAFKPDLILISAGFTCSDANIDSSFYSNLVAEDYEWITGEIIKVANGCCNGRVISVLDSDMSVDDGILSSLTASVAAHVQALKTGAKSAEIWDSQKSVQEGVIEEEIFLQQTKKRSASKIQARQRGISVRLNWPLKVIFPRICTLQNCYRRWTNQKRFKVLKLGFIALQTCFRRRKQVKFYQIVKKSVLAIQTCSRRHLREKNWKILKKGALGLQTSIRRWVLTKQYKRIIARMVAAQTCFRRWRARTRFKRTVQQMIAVQTCVRRWVAQRIFKRTISRVIAAQTCFRRWKAQAWFKLTIARTISVQACIRKWVAQTKFKRTVAQMVKIEACVRMWIARTKFKRTVSRMIAVQTCFRRWRTEIAFQLLRKTIILIQAFIRGTKICCGYKSVKWRTIIIQTWFRKMKAQSAFKKTVKAAVTLQKYSRKWIAFYTFQKVLIGVIALQSHARRKKQRKEFLILVWRLKLFQAIWKRHFLTHQRFELARCSKAARVIQCYVRMKMQTDRYQKRKRAARIRVDYDPGCKQLFVANRSELYNIFLNYMDKVHPVIKRKNATLFAVNFRIVPALLTKTKFDQLITELITILNEDPDSKEPHIEMVEAPLHFMAFLSMLILIVCGIPDNKNGNPVPLDERLSSLFKMLDISGGKQKMGGSLNRNAFSLGDMIYIGSPKLPSIEKARSFDIHQWLMHTHFRGSQPSSKQKPASPRTNSKQRESSLSPTCTPQKSKPQRSKSGTGDAAELRRHRSMGNVSRNSSLSSKASVTCSMGMKVPPASPALSDERSPRVRLKMERDPFCLDVEISPPLMLQRANSAPETLMQEYS